jgi:hypothetical protein
MTYRLTSASAIVSVALSSCGTGSYQRDFERASVTLVRPSTTAAGPWQGTWKSDANGHHGPLWCIVEPTPAKSGSFNFRYRAGWGAVNFGDYTHTTPTRLEGDGSIRLSGEMPLPGGLGIYQVRGRLTRDAFDATYHSAADHGTMTLRRPTMIPSTGKD